MISASIPATVSASTCFQPCGNTITRAYYKPSVGPRSSWQMMRPPCKLWPTSTFSQRAWQLPRGLCHCRLPLALQRRVLRGALTEVMGGLQGVTATHIAAIVALLRSGAGHQRLTLPQGVVVERRYDVLLIHRQAPTAVVHVDVSLPVPGVCRVEALGVTIMSDQLPRHAVAGPFPSGDVTWLDAERVGQDVRVRTRRSGDRLQPLGSVYAKKLKAFLIDAKIPHALRDRLPLVVTSTGIAWVAGVRPAEWAKVTPTTRAILRLQLFRHAPEKAVDTAFEHR
jgi:tRNA(Ile)-lysidine synthase